MGAAFRGLAGEGGCTMRIVTCRYPGEEPRVLVRVLRMPTGDAYVDNLAAGGIASWIHEDGRLGPATRKIGAGEEFVKHPDSGAPIEGFEVPSLDEAEALCLGAHEALPEVPFVGWDVLPAKEGMLLLEANLGWCADLAQAPSLLPLGDSDFIPCYMSHYRERFERDGARGGRR